MIRLGIDATPLQNISGGIGFYLFDILNCLIEQRKDVIFVLYCFQNEGSLLHFSKYKNVIVKEVTFMSKYHAIWTQTGLAKQVWKDKLDYFWGITQFTPLMKRKNLKTILTIHDFVYLLHPETMNFMKQLFMRILTPYFISRSFKVICISQGTKEKLKRFYKKSCHDTISPPIKASICFKNENESLEILQSYGLKQNQFILTVGSIEPRKNIIALLDFYETLLKKHNSDDLLPLAIVGGGGWKNTEIFNKINEMKTMYPNHIKVLGFAPEDRISYLYSAARYFVFFSKYEGYGMPLAESRTCNTPIICFDQIEMREASENDGIYLPTSGYESILEPFFLRQSAQITLNKTCRYMSTKEKALKLSAVIQ